MSHFNILDVAALPLVIVAMSRFVDSVMFVVTASISLWSRNPARRAEARRLLSWVRGRDIVD